MCVCLYRRNFRHAAYIWASLRMSSTVSSVQRGLRRASNEILLLSNSLQQHPCAAVVCLPYLVSSLPLQEMSISAHPALTERG